MSNALKTLENATRMLAEVSTAKEAKKVMDLAAAAELYAKKANLGEESELYAHKIRVDAQTLLGGFLKQMPKNKGETGGRPKANGKPGIGRKPGLPTFKSNGISKTLAFRSQALHTAKEKAPKLHEAVRERKVAVAQVPQAMARYRMTDAEKEALEIKNTKLCTTRWLEKISVSLNSGTCAKMQAKEIDVSLSVYAKDPERKMTPARLDKAARHLLAISYAWQKLL